MQKKASIPVSAFSAIVLVLSHVIPASGATDPHILLKRVQEKLKKAKSISYDIRYRLKCFDCDDTTVYEARVDILRVPNDSLVGFYVLAHFKDGFTKLYSGDTIYYITPKDSSIEIVDTRKYPRNPLQGNFHDYVFSKSFIDPSRLDSTGATHIEFLRDSTIKENQILHALLIQRDSADGFAPDPAYLVIDPSIDFGIYSRGGTRWSAQSQYQYDEASYSHVEFDKVDSNYFKSYKLPQDYKITFYEPKRPLNEKPLPNDTIAPDFVAKIYPDTNQVVRLSDYRGKIVVLDFWYTTCYPCVQALPALSEISNTYSSKGVVILGMNSFDLRGKRFNKLPDFFKHNPIPYSTIFPARSVDQSYHVIGYPTVYIIDKNGSIAFSQVGYGPKAEKRITDKLDELLK